jgi:hypothetical protein
VVIDRERGRCLLVDLGWEGLARVLDVLVHVEVIDGKLSIQYDGTEDFAAAWPRDRGHRRIARSHRLLTASPSRGLRF